jgi:hypothetical protein
MTGIQKLLTAAVITATAAMGIYEIHQVSQFQDRLEADRVEQQRFADQSEQLRMERDEATNRLATLQQEIERLRRELAELPKLRGELSASRTEDHQLAQSKTVDASSSTESAAKDWQGRVDQLRHYLEQNRQAWIPELKLLTESGWLEATRGDLRTDTDYRVALSRLRAEAETTFVDSQLQPALKRYVDANNGQFPDTLAQLEQFFQPPVDAEVLQRYEIVPHEKVPAAAWGGDWVVTLKAAVDKDYDRRVVVGASGGWGRVSF